MEGARHALLLESDAGTMLAGTVHLLELGTKVCLSRRLKKKWESDVEMWFQFIPIFLKPNLLS